MMNSADHQIYQALADGRDKLSERFEAMEDSRNLWRGLAIVLLAVTALDILRELTGWTL